jgi:opacity protein-like surface antigen
MRLLIVLLGVLSVTSAWADKDGFYLGAGISSNIYSSSDDDDFNDVFEDERSIGGRLEFGHLWDVAQPGGLHIGVAATYDSFGEVERAEKRFGEYARVSFDAQAFSVLFVIEQELVSWVDIVFKIGPSSVNTKMAGNIGYNTASGYYVFSDSESQTEIGGTAIIGLTFFPTNYLAIELARQGTVYVDSDTDDACGAGSWSISLQYRF